MRASPSRSSPTKVPCTRYTACTPDARSNSPASCSVRRLSRALDVVGRWACSRRYGEVGASRVYCWCSLSGDGGLGAGVDAVLVDAVRLQAKVAAPRLVRSPVTLVPLEKHQIVHHVVRDELALVGPPPRLPIDAAPRAGIEVYLLKRATFSVADVQRHGFHL